MAWSKTKQLLEGFLCPALIGRVEYTSTSYRYLPDKSGQCYIMVDKRKIFNMNDASSPIKWYKTEQEIRKDPDIEIPISSEEIEAIRRETKGAVPEDKLKVIAGNRKIAEVAKEIYSAQSALSKSDFNAVASKFFSSSIEECLESRDILLNVLALIDRRIGKKRLLNMADRIKLKHPVVQYFYNLRVSTL